MCPEGVVVELELHNYASHVIHKWGNHRSIGFGIQRSGIAKRCGLSFIYISFRSMVALLLLFGFATLGIIRVSTQFSPALA